MSLASTISVLEMTCISTREELHLFRYFVSTVARNLDITDPACHFANEAPLQAQSNQVLAYALLAASARHLSQTTEYSPVIADRYHQQCLELLIPFLDDATAVLSEILLSTIRIWVSDPTWGNHHAIFDIAAPDVEQK
ncbi:hypothetical protein D6D08_04301, partial [Aureobasidium pullulans]